MSNHTIFHIINTYVVDTTINSCMSKILATVAACNRTVAKARRTIEHSPEFGSDDDPDEDGRPTTRIPPGGFLTG